MSVWPSKKAKKVLAALKRIGWTVKRPFAPKSPSTIREPAAVYHVAQVDYPF